MVVSFFFDSLSTSREIKVVRIEEKFLSSGLREDTEGKAGELEEMNKKAKEDDSMRWKREFEGQMDRVAAVCKE